MGGSKQYNADGGFITQTYKQSGTTSNGIKILDSNINQSNGLPLFSNTPHTMYAERKNEKVIQISVYGGGKDGRMKLKDIDWGHPHKNNGVTKMWQIGQIHVHEYNGRTRSTMARNPSTKERRLAMMASYGG